MEELRSLLQRRFASTFSWNIPNPYQLLQIPIVSSLLSGSVYRPDVGSSAASSCPNAQLSCHNTSTVLDTCCFEYPGGQLLQTQFWDTQPPNGPKDSWTVHGLWSDHCDGGFDQFCDVTRSYNNITSILSSLNAKQLLHFMNIYWRADKGPDENLWAHEWNKHGTCMSTLETRCYDEGRYKAGEEVKDYFTATTALFRKLDTYKILASGSILPSQTRTYSLAELQGPLQTKQGVPVTLRCQNGALSEVWYHFDVLGSVRHGKFVPAAPDGAKSNCPAEGIRYLPKGDAPRPTSTVTKTGTASGIEPSSSPTSSPFAGRGHLQVLIDGKAEGCLISTGLWYTSGPCAGFRVQNDAKDVGKNAEHLFTLTSAKGPCSIYQGSFQCAKTLPIQTIFSANGSSLAYQGSVKFSADSKPGRFEKVAVYPGEKTGDIDVGLHWVY